jgi:hypothetical protein
MNAAFNRIEADLDRHRHLFDLDRDDLGRKLCKAATDGVQHGIGRQEAPDGTPWAPLSEKYDEWKSFQFPGNPIAVLRGTMADPNEVAGEVEVKVLEATVTYGVSAKAKDEAEWFSDGNGAGQPGRPFFGLTAEGLAGSKSLLDARFAKV